MLRCCCCFLCGAKQGAKGRRMRLTPQEDPQQHFAWALPRAAFRDTLRLMGRGWLGGDAAAAAPEGATI